MPFLSFASEKNSPEAPVSRISVMASGKILLDGKEATIAEVKRALETTKAKRGAVWYYRESGKGEPPVQAIEVFKLIVEKKLPISLSTKPDFSDYVDEQGQSLPRK
jgi:GTP cyclohydrolase II